MSKIKLEIDCDLAINPLEFFFSHIPEPDRAPIWNLAQSFFPKLIFNAISNLSKAVKNPNFKNTSKLNPFIETSYPVQIKWSDIEKEISENLDKISKELPNIITKIPLENRQEQLLNIINRNRFSLANNDIEFDIPNEYIKYQNLINGDIQKILFENKTPLSRIKFKGEFLSKKLQFEGVIFVIFTPLLIIKSTEEVRFPIFVGLKTLDNVHESFNTKQESDFWKELLCLIKQSLSIDNTKNLFLEQILTTPDNPIIKSPMHLEALKHGRRPNPQLKLPILEEGMPPVEVIGLNLDKKHYHALNAIQKILSETKYKGNAPGTELDGNNTFKFTGYLPKIRFSRSQYLESYGVTKYETSRGKWEFSGREGEEALSALKDLATQNHLIVVRKKRWENGRELIDRIQAITPIIHMYEGWEGLTEKEDKELNDNIETKKVKEKHKGFLIEPCPLLVEQIETYFVLKPANMYQEIKLKFPYASKYVYMFIDWIIHESHLKKGKNNKKEWPEFLEIGQETLAYNLRLDCYIKSRNWKRIDQILKKCIQISVDLGWVNKHEETQGKTVSQLHRFFLNQKKFDCISKNTPLKQEKIALA